MFPSVHLTKKYIKPSNTLYSPALGLGEELTEAEGLNDAEGEALLEAERLAESEGDKDAEDELLKLKEALALAEGERRGRE